LRQPPDRAGSHWHLISRQFRLRAVFSLKPRFLSVIPHANRQLDGRFETSARSFGENMNESFKNFIETETAIQFDSFQKYKSVDFSALQCCQGIEKGKKNRPRGAAEEKSRPSRSTSLSAPWMFPKTRVWSEKVKSNSCIPNHRWVSQSRKERLESQNAFASPHPKSSACAERAVRRILWILLSRAKNILSRQHGRRRSWSCGNSRTFWKWSTRKSRKPMALWRSGRSRASKRGSPKRQRPSKPNLPWSKTATSLKPSPRSKKWRKVCLLLTQAGLKFYLVHKFAVHEKRPLNSHKFRALQRFLLSRISRKCFYQ